jgi:hypothetical protein
MLQLKSPQGELLFLVSSLVYTVFWVWAVIHATHTPRANIWQRALWGIAIVANPFAAVWYWYIWKRQVFWALFTPFLGATISLPFAIRTVLSKADTTALTDILFALGSARLLILVATLMIFPLLLRLAALIHLGKNTELSAMDRNDWIVSLALPIFGYGAGIAYCAHYRRAWAIVGLAWSLVIAIALKTVTVNIGQALVPAGQEKRVEILQQR